MGRKMNLRAIIILLLIFILVNMEVEAQEIEQDAYDSIIMAIDSLVNDDFIKLPESTKMLVMNTPLLAVQLLGISHSRESNILLSRANALRLDAALAEEQTCVILKKGKGMLPFLKTDRTKLKDLMLACEKDARKLKIDPSKVCAKQPDIARRIDTLVALLKKGEKCEQNK